MLNIFHMPRVRLFVLNQCAVIKETTSLCRASVVCSECGYLYSFVLIQSVINLGYMHGSQGASQKIALR